MRVRRQVLGSDHVERASAGITDLDRDFQRFITRTAWGGVWTRPHFDPRTRSLLTLALMAALGHHEEFKLHVRATRNTGATPEDIGELLIHVAAYAGIPPPTARCGSPSRRWPKWTGRAEMAVNPADSPVLGTLYGSDAMRAVFDERA